MFFDMYRNNTISLIFPFYAENGNYIMFSCGEKRYQKVSLTQPLVEEAVLGFSGINHGDKKNIY